MQSWWAGTRCWPTPLWKRSEGGASRHVRKSPPRLWNFVLIRPDRGDGEGPKRWMRKVGIMNIKKKLYLSFGAILATVLVLLAINLGAVQREHDTKAAAQRSID